MTKIVRLGSFCFLRTLFCFFLTLPLCPPLVRAAGGGQGSQTCPSSGSKRISSTSLKTTIWFVQAPSANTGQVYIGFSSGVTTSTGIYLNAGDSLTNPPQGNAATHDLSQVYIACTQSADSITYSYEQ